MKERIVVVGGNAGGMSAAAIARRRTDADEVEIHAIETGPYVSYSSCGLPYLVAGYVDTADDLIARTAAEHQANGIHVRTGQEVLAIDLENRRVEVASLRMGERGSEPFDKLLVATGSQPVRPDLSGVDARGVHGLHSIPDAHEIMRAIEPGTRVAVVGGGYIGLEMAEALHRRGLDVTMIEAGKQPMNTLDPDMGALVAEAVRGLGIELLTDTPSQGFEADDEGRVRAVATPNGSIAADLVVLGIGVKPNTALARAAGIEVGATGGIVTDARMQTSAEGVWAAGDCVESFHRVSRRKVVIALGTHANKQGRVAGINMTGGDETFPGVIGTAVTKVCEYEVGRTGLTESEAAAAGFDHDATIVESTTRSGYYPGSEPITVKMVYDRPSGRILGGQVIGREGAAKRIDVLAVAIWNEMTVDEFWKVDLGYAPPVSPLWDPALVAARRAAGT